MGSFFSDVRGGQERVGAGSRSAGSGNAAPERNDAVDHLLISRGLRGLYSQVELSVSATKLRDRDVLSSSDPMAVLFAKKPDGKLQEIGRTEVIMNSLNPAWITKFIVNYQFEIVQPLVFQIFDVDTKYHNTPVKTLQLNDQDFLGEATCVLSEIVTKPTRNLVLGLHDKKARHAARLGSITVHAEETVSSRTVIEMTLRCSNLQKRMFSIRDPFLIISRVLESGGSIPICKTEVIKNNLNPVWKTLVLTMQQFGSKDNPLLVHCYDFNSNGNHQLLGQLQASISTFEKHNRERAGISFYSGKKMLKGQLFIDSFIEKTQYTFIDYISSGFELNFMVAIDFTASNGNPRLPESLHFIDPTGRLNAYQQVKGL
ncbi:Protein BONZAI 3 [Apostasia shenzhenica]|uniref:Protein BONZAI 3 n=1 Tax=Apostasia shenzhenica TaxID=1088818 RepID=A0A2I0BAJ1_9ASPA|nr:Protein BONZAI 3 [Apostasia shenzhenica]